MKRLIYLILPILVLIGCSSDDNSHDRSKVYIVSQKVEAKKINETTYESTITYVVKNDYKPVSVVYYYIESEIENYGKRRTYGDYKRSSNKVTIINPDEAKIVVKGDKPVIESDIKNSTIVITEIVDDPVAN
ncbi:hypothetical protein HX049_02730 [Myroides odoratimimus]|uniref:hypothetical protein n=1 Tax=Myroides odoratimimus TaxID=76832 RepID=UPI00257589FF|nr:hypothetical protein [Myroides odoratimimus]MDM1396096.1 hypothetical protein [Myroides odoratimimus]